jgi:hypothetical protein
LLAETILEWEKQAAPYRQAGDVACWRCGTTANSEKGAGPITPLPRITSYVRSQLSWSALNTKNLVSTAISVYTFDERRQNRNLAGATVNAPGAELADSSRSHERLVGSLIQQKCNKIYALTSAESRLRVVVFVSATLFNSFFVIYGMEHKRNKERWHDEQFRL